MFGGSLLHADCSALAPAGDGQAKLSIDSHPFWLILFSFIIVITILLNLLFEFLMVSLSRSLN